VLHINISLGRFTHPGPACDPQKHGHVATPRPKIPRTRCRAADSASSSSSTSPAIHLQKRSSWKAIGEELLDVTYI
jgi:hypothetical protein